MNPKIFVSIALLFVLHASGYAQIQTEELYRFRMQDLRHLYKIGPSVPAELGKMTSLGPVFLVARNNAPGLRPIYMSSAQDDKSGAVSYFYSKTTTPPDRFSNTQVAFYVAGTQLPGTVPVYGFWEVFYYSNYGKVWHGKSNFRFKTDPEPPTASWYAQGLMGYVWPLGAGAGPATNLPDLSILKTTVRENGIEAWIKNGGTTSISSKPGVTAVLYVYDQTGKNVVHFSGGKQLGGMSGGQQRPFLFETGNLDLKRKKYRVVVDAATLVAESNENNNDTGFLDTPTPKMKIPQLPEGYVRPPTIMIKSINPAANGRMRYSLNVTNVENFHPKAFQSLKDVLPSSQCGNVATDTRMIARIIVIRDVPIPGGCKPLYAAQDLGTVELTVPTKLKDTDRIKISIEDRASGQKFDSEPFAVGWFGIANVLGPSGCKGFGGSASNYFCSTDPGFKTCENLRLQGKPIQCRRTGKPQ